ncbi:hypothetical protein, partial [Achromobacter animicus]|uniref:hypothetical protein n=1 Tax=Achromobacter animicus TaxID=1389935 RepID=UPI0028ABCAAB
MQQRLAVVRVQIQRLAVCGLRLPRLPFRVQQQTLQMQRVGAGAVDLDVRQAFRHGVSHPAQIGQRGDLAQRRLRGMPGCGGGRCGWRIGNC